MLLQKGLQVSGIVQYLTRTEILIMVPGGTQKP